MARTKTSRTRPVKRPKIATLFCAEGLRASACVAIDALTVRGWSVKLQTGDAAREALKRFRDPRAGLRVLCVPEPLCEDAAQALHRALDPYQRGDLLIVDFFTPRALVESILRFSGYRVGPRRSAASRRTTRSYLAQPTLVEHAVDVGYWSRYGVGAAAAGVAILGGMSTFWAIGPELEPAPRAAAVAREPAPASPLVDRSALSATRAAPELAPPPPQPKRKRARPQPATEIPEEPPASLEEVELPEVPVEGLVAVERRRPMPEAIGRGGAPGLPASPSLHTLDPFSTP